ncbi:UNVERIFIED_CONTAM: hypothetical protein H355_014154 [Colinus virginianus]|nr:hypothetical protein H355_014154 [Colinus virginianus]
MCPRPEPGQPGERPPLRLVLTVAAWLGTGTALAGLNKWIFASHGFRYPLLLSSLHMLAAVVLGYPLGWAVHATAPLATLLLSALLRGRRHHPLQYAAMGPVCAGAACSIAGGVRFHQPGGCVLLAATVLRALKSLQQSLLLQDGRLDAVSLLCLTALPSFCLLFGAAVLLEVAPAWQGVLRYDGSLWGCVLLSCLGSVLYNLASFCVLSLTSALTIHLLGNITVVGNLLLSRLLFGSSLSALSYLGIALTLAGMFMYQQPQLVAQRWAVWVRQRSPRHQ